MSGPRMVEFVGGPLDGEAKILPPEVTFLRIPQRSDHGEHIAQFMESMTSAWKAPAAPLVYAHEYRLHAAREMVYHGTVKV